MRSAGNSLDWEQMGVLNKRWKRAMLLLALLPWLCAAVQAREPSAAYGEELVRAGAQWDEAFPTAGLTAVGEQLAALQRSPVLSRTEEDQAQLLALRAEVRSREAQFGPYASGLDEPLAALAMLEWRSGRAEAAQTLIERALHVTRVNGGLYGSAQRDTVARLLAMHRLRGDFSGLDARYEYFFRLHGSGRPPHDASSREATLEYLRWQREALRRDLPPADERLIDLHGRNKYLIDTLRKDMQEGSLEELDFLQALVLSQVRNLYLVQARVEPELDPRFSTGTGSVIMRQQPRPNSLGGMDITRERLLSLQRSAYAEGRLLLEQLLEQLPATDRERRANVLRELGDWYQWHGSLRSAQLSYTEAIALLTAAGEPQLIAAAWGEPVELPDNGVFHQPPELMLQAAADGQKPVVLANFEVNRSGRVQSIALYNLNGEPLRDFRLVRSLRATAFRPAFRDGDAVAMVVQGRPYQIID